LARCIRSRAPSSPRRWARDRGPAPRALQEQSGFGVVASVDGERTILGRRALLEVLSLVVLGAFSFRDLRVDRCSPARSRDAVRDRCRSGARSLVVWPIHTGAGDHRCGDRRCSLNID